MILSWKVPSNLPEAPVVQKVNNAIHWINLYPRNNATGNVAEWLEAPSSSPTLTVTFASSLLRFGFFNTEDSQQIFKTLL